MIKITAQHDCGCCFATMQFNSIDSAKAAFAQAGLCNGANITDDEGTIHEGIDTFYGFSEDEKEFDRSPLARLAEIVGIM